MSNTKSIRLFTLPNALTLANLVAGAIAIVFALKHQYEVSFWLIIAAAVCDFFDGFVARLLHQQSELGVQLDSLADDISFGLAPAVVMFDIYGQSTSYYNFDTSIMQPLSYVVFIIAAFSASAIIAGVAKTIRLPDPMDAAHFSSVTTVLLIYERPSLIIFFLIYMVQNMDNVLLPYNITYLAKVKKINQ